MDKPPWDTGIARVLLEMKTEIIDSTGTMTEELRNFRESLIEALQSAIAHKFRSGDLDTYLLSILTEQELSFQVGTVVTSTVTKTAVEALVAEFDQLRASNMNIAVDKEVEESKPPPKVIQGTKLEKLGEGTTKHPVNHPFDPEERERTLSNLQDPPLARRLLEWALSENTDMKQAWKNEGSMKQLSYCRNKVVNEMVALCCVHQYASGAIGTTPSKQKGRLESLRGSDPLAYSRGTEMASFLERFHKKHFSQPELIKEHLLQADLYSKLDHYQRGLKKFGLFDPEAKEQCFHSKQTSGGYWKHFRKLNKAVDGLHEKASIYLEEHDFFMSPESVREFEANRGLLYVPAKQKRDMVVERKRNSDGAPTDGGGARRRNQKEARIRRCNPKEKAKSRRKSDQIVLV